MYYELNGNINSVFIIYICLRVHKKEESERRNSAKFFRIYNKLSFVQKQFIDMLLRNSDIGVHGRRYTQEEKIISLSIFKRSAKCYTFLRTFLPLPSPTSLKTVLKKIKLDAEANGDTRRRLKETAKGLSEKEKVMILISDELLLGTGLSYDKELDKIVGFEDWGNGRTEKFADHALVFMLRSLHAGNKIPVSFCFCCKQTTTVQSLYSIKEVIGAIKDAGFNIVASVCDGGSSNQAATRTLLEDTVKLKGEEYVLKSKSICMQKLVSPSKSSPYFYSFSFFAKILVFSLFLKEIPCLTVTNYNYFNSTCF